MRNLNINLRFIVYRYLHELKSNDVLNEYKKRFNVVENDDEDANDFICLYDDDSAFNYRILRNDGDWECYGEFYRESAQSILHGIGGLIVGKLPKNY